MDLCAGQKAQRAARATTTPSRATATLYRIPRRFLANSSTFLQAARAAPTRLQTSAPICQAIATATAACRPTRRPALGCYKRWGCHVLTFISVPYIRAFRTFKTTFTTACKCEVQPSTSISFTSSERSPRLWRPTRRSTTYYGEAYGSESRCFQAALLKTGCKLLPCPHALNSTLRSCHYIMCNTVICGVVTHWMCCLCRADRNSDKKYAARCYAQQCSAGTNLACQRCQKPCSPADFTSQRKQGVVSLAKAPTHFLSLRDRLWSPGADGRVTLRIRVDSKWIDCPWAGGKVTVASWDRRQARMPAQGTRIPPRAR